MQSGRASSSPGGGGATFLDDNRVGSGTKTNYNSKINIIKEYLFTKHPEVIDTTVPKNKIKVPLEQEVIESLFGWLATRVATKRGKTKTTPTLQSGGDDDDRNGDDDDERNVDDEDNYDTFYFNLR